MNIDVRASAIRVLSVTAVAATACALSAGAASAATAKHVTKTTVSVAKTAYVGARVTMSARVTDDGHRPTGTVAFWLGTRRLCHASLSGYTARCSAAFASAADKTITAKYAGTASFKASSGTTRINVVRSATTTKITNVSPGSVDSGKKFTFNVTVTSAAGTPAATGSVVVAPTAPANLGAAFTCTASVSGGKGSCTITTEDYGIIDYAATYAGNAAHAGSAYAGPFELAVQNVTTTAIAAVTTTAGDVQLNADVYSEGANVDSANGGTGTVTFYASATAGDAGAAVADCSDVLLSSFDAGTGDNVATCGPANNTLNGLKAGTTYYVTAVYSGDPVNVGSASEQFALTPTP